MEPTDKTVITVEVKVNLPVEKTWELWNDPEHITKWCFASDDWQTSRAENDLRVGGKFLSRMEAKDGSFGFDFEGVYVEVKPNKSIVYCIADGRKVDIVFNDNVDSTTVIETFEAENENPPEMQKNGWQSILNNFKKYAEMVE